MAKQSDYERPQDFRKRQSDRRALNSAATANLTRGDWYSVEVVVRNVSTCGFMAECHEPIDIGSFVSLDVPGIGLVDAQIRWQIGGRMGGKFVDPISLTECEWTASKSQPPLRAA